MDQVTADKLAATLDRVERKLDEVLAFRDQVMQFAAAGLSKKLGFLAKTRISGGE